MNRIFLLCSLCLIIFSCKKSNPEPSPIIDQTKSYSNKIVIDNAKLVGDSISLSWSKLDTSEFVEYRIMRQDYDGIIFKTIAASTNINSVKFVDKNIPYNYVINYQIEGRLKSGVYITSNTASVNRLDITGFGINPFDAIFDKDNRLIYLFEKLGTISIYDLRRNEIVNKISLTGTNGYSDFGIYNTKKELYVPGNFGLGIYDAVTLQKIDQIDISFNAISVVSSNSNLYVATNAWLQNPLKVYSRKTKKLISQNGNFDDARLKKIPDTDSEILEISLRSNTNNLNYYKFLQSGDLVNRLSQNNSYVTKAEIFEFFPDGKSYITSSNGAIYNSDMTFKATLSDGHLSFTSFDFNKNSNEIYAATQNKTIEVYDLNNYQHKRTIQTKAYPLKIFDDGSKIICISKPFESNDGYSYYGESASLRLGGIIIENLNK
ncbi:hypothetical protein [Mucilaginibacter sp. KACC 22063]|uniref:hypothetical protein n=1 Tax=Mucilaginibacter sp. KACC 22063 TaxID=3025666 RepID=UPI002365CBFF|nr:hypothetical protein [Mucilaginibacter sp. KACC 22063]WDF54765.1 hypothetical protein PQ461_17685 [Mucilaginibacter sp. KACC 22063]